MSVKKPKILAVDDNSDGLYALERMLSHHGYEVIAVTSGEEALRRAEYDRPDLIFLDVMMPHMDGLEATRRFKADPALRFIPIVLLTAKDSLADVVQGLDNGADGYITKPFKPEELLARTRAALRLKAVYEELRTTGETRDALLRELSAGYDTESIVGESPAIREVLRLTEKVAPSSSPVLISGPSGTGKELIARAIHGSSTRRDRPFIAKNCAVFSEHLLESQLFGHTKGSFTGAIKDQIGLFEAADGGTLFLDEIGELAIELQAKLLRVLQEGTFMPVGSTEERQVDVRIIAATNRNLRRMADEGKFRDDLYYRLAVITIELPPLSARREDIPLLVEHFLAQRARRQGTTPHRVSSRALDLLTAHEWRGNIRELENQIERMLILAGDEPELGEELLSPEIRSGASVEPAVERPPQSGDLRQALEAIERQMLLDALTKTGWNKTNAAKLLGISRSNLIAKVQQFALEQQKNG